jgi:GNAT superfamily N-acetyltransferase/SAM-dependent methyltransferase
VTVFARIMFAESRFNFTEAEAGTVFPDFGVACPTNRLDFSTQSSSKTFIAKCAKTSKIIGVASCSPWNGCFPSVVKADSFFVGIISLCYVIEEHRRQGVAKTLIDICIAHLQSIGCKQVILSAESQSGVDFFENCGFDVGNVLSVQLDNTPTAQPVHNISIIAKGPECDNDVVSNWKAMWTEAGIPESSLENEFSDITLGFISEARSNLGYQTFAAIDTSGGKETVCGTVSCQLVNPSSPQMLLKGSTVMGTVWAVYVNPAYRCRGIARALMCSVMKHWKTLGCTEGALMYASQNGRRVYERLGFAPCGARTLALSMEIPRCPSVCLTTPRDGLPQDSGSADSDVASVSGESASCDVSLGSDDIVGNGIEMLRERPSLSVHSDVYLCQLLHALQRQLEALATLSQLAQTDNTHQDPNTFHILDHEDIVHVIDVQRRLGFFIDPQDNWLTQNIKRFGKGFDMMELARDPALLAAKFDKLSSKYDEWASGNKSKVDLWIAKQAWHFASSYGQGSTRVLDVACGIGLPAQTTRLCGWSGHFTCSDISPGMVKRAKQRGACDDGFVCDVNQGMCDVADGSYNVVICTGALELLDHAVVLPEFHRIIAPGGMLWASFQMEDPDGAAPSTAHQNVKGISSHQAISRLEACGFRVRMDRCEACWDAFYTPSFQQDGSMLPVPYFFVVAEK